MLLVLLVCCGCEGKPPADAGFVATIPPIRMILSEIVGADSVGTLVQAGASPHAFELLPSHARQVQDARALVYVAHNLDGWAEQLPAKKTIEAFALVPESEALIESHGDHAHEANPHFWSDPLLVRDVAPQLAAQLLPRDAAEAAHYATQLEHFRDDLQALDTELRSMLAPVMGRSVIVMHPSWTYFFRRYGIVTAGALEPAPGHEPSPKDLEHLIAAAKAQDVRAVLSEPQLPRAPAAVLAEAIGVAVYEIDPLGGVPGRDTYEELLRYNAGILLEALR